MIELRNLSKSFATADGQVDALRHVNLTVNDGDIYGIIGMSGAGKSTLVRCINMLERPTEGSVVWDGVDLGLLSKHEIRQARRQITMIFQSFNLLMQRTCLPTPIPPSSPAASSSAWQSPARWRRTPRYCSATKRPPRWIRKLPTRSWS